MMSQCLVAIAFVFALQVGFLFALATPSFAEGCRSPRVVPATTALGAGPASGVLHFVPNAGQVDSRVRYYVQGTGYTFFFSPEEAVFVFLEDGARREVVLRLRFVGASPHARLEGRHADIARVSYFVGSDAPRWRADLGTYREIVYQDLWPGIDLAFRGANGRLKYEFVVRPGARAETIRLAYSGLDGLSLDKAGNLVLATALGALTDQRPWTYQEIGGRRVTVESRFVVQPAASDEHVYAFGVQSSYDVRHPLIIDPGLAYSTFLGGNRGDIPFAIAVDRTGHAYVTGITSSANFPVTAGARPFAGFCDVFVTKFDPAGGRLLYSTYLGGSGCDEGRAIVVDAAGNAYVGGMTPSPNFPTTAGAFAPDRTGKPAGDRDGFLVKLDAGGGLAYATYLGGSGTDGVGGLAVDDTGTVYLAGTTSSTDFPTTAGAFDRTCGTDGNCNPRSGARQSDAFVARLDPRMAGPASLLSSTYLGGGAADGFPGVGVAVDTSGHIYVAGRTDSPDFPVTEDAFDTSYNSPPGDFFRGGDLFIAKLDPGGSRLVYSTFLGGGGTEESGGIAIDALGHVYVAASVIANNCCLPPFVSDFPTTSGAFNRTFRGFVDLVVAKLDPSRPGPAGLLYATFLGGTGTDGIGLLGTTGAVAVDAPGNAYVTGATNTRDFPTTPGAFARGPGLQAGGEGFVAKLDPTGSRLLYGTYFGGACGDFGFNSDNAVAITVDAAGNTYVTGITLASTFPTTEGAFDRTINSIGAQGGDGFVSKLATTPQGQVEVLMADVARLIAAGTVASGSGNALRAPLGAAIQQLNRGADTAAINALDSFASQVLALIRTDTITPDQGQPLIDDARAIIDFIKYLGA